ncbi:MAG: hypothetical protein CFH06_01268 [Alphaproteobacteria bacterium MarineAlpha3_Bin5]|nr:MAG: hypothetical protein CFH06_01268 [Alphaproteobacteria bacterium MarineAlpha3_Bin5]
MLQKVSLAGCLYLPKKPGAMISFETGQIFKNMMKMSRFGSIIVLKIKC